MGIELISNRTITYPQGSKMTADSVPQNPDKISTDDIQEDPSTDQSASVSLNVTDVVKSTVASKDKQNEKLRKAVDELNKKTVNSEAIFEMHEKTNNVIIKIIDKDTKKVIKEYPAEETLNMIAKLWEVAGLMVDEKR